MISLFMIILLVSIQDFDLFMKTYFAHSLFDSLILLLSHSSSWLFMQSSSSTNPEVWCIIKYGFSTSNWIPFLFFCWILLIWWICRDFQEVQISLWTTDSVGHPPSTVYTPFPHNSLLPVDLRESSMWKPAHSACIAWRLPQVCLILIRNTYFS